MTAPTNTTVERWALRFNMVDLILLLKRLGLWLEPEDA